MPGLFQRLFMSAQKRRYIKGLLSDNAKEFKAVQARIDDDEDEERAEVMRQYANATKAAVDDGERDRLTVEAERRCNEVGRKARIQREEARQAYERRIEQILSLH